MSWTCFKAFDIAVKKVAADEADSLFGDAWELFFDMVFSGTKQSF